MNPMYRSDQTDVAALQMENDLLTHEVRHLRARLSALGIDPGAQGAEMKKVAKRNARAYDDVRWLVRRLDGSPLGPVLRRTGGFRVMVKRYGKGKA